MKEMKIMDYLTKSFILILLLCSCNAHKGDYEEPIFLYEDLQDSIEKYVNLTAPILNEMDLPTITQVIFDLIDGDTLIIIRPALSPYPSGRDSIVGANMLGGRICEFVYGVYGAIDQMAGVVNNELLTIPQKDYDPILSLPPEKQFDEQVLRTIQARGKMNRVYIMSRPSPLRLVIKDGIRLDQ